MRPASRTLAISLAILLGMLALADVLTSAWILGLGGQELNPLMSPFASDPAAFFGIKCLALASILLLAVLSNTIQKDAGILILLTACGIAIQPVVWNSFLLLLPLQ